jgi:DNA polymerase III delta prime subunit
MTENNWDFPFKGRQDELRDLIKAWNKAKSNHPQLLLLLGDSGYGKTRLIMEFYGWLSKHEDEAEPNGYWPDSLGRDGNSLNVNPSFENHHAQGEIPWLWWGLRWHDLKRNKTPSSLSHFFPDLAPHVDPIVRRRQRKELIKKTGSLLLGWITLGGSQAIQTTFNIIKDGSEAIDYAKKTWDIHQSGGRYLHAISESERAKPADACLDFLAAILDRDDPESKTFPVVLILDDAQWMDRVSLRFLKQLFERAMRSNWPLLVIATHWEYLWHENFLTAKGLSPGQPDTIESNFAELILTFETDGVLTDWVPYRIGKLSNECIRELTRLALPGLTLTQLDCIELKVDGNPTYLGDVIAYLKHSLRHFIDKDPTKSLSELGESVFENIIHTDHMGLIRKRFDSLGEDLSLLLAQASYQGIRFNEEITSEVAIKLGEFQDMDRLRLLFQEASYPKTITDLVGEH